MKKGIPAWIAGFILTSLSAQASVPSHLPLTQIARDVNALAELIDKQSHGRDSDITVVSTVPAMMVREYLKKKYGRDADSLGYKVKINQTSMPMDEPIAGTLMEPMAEQIILSQLRDASFGTKLKATMILNDMINAGATFGFDGFEQNGCAAPTPYLLVFDSQAHHVYGLDLSPCSES